MEPNHTRRSYLKKNLKCFFAVVVVWTKKFSYAIDVLKPGDKQKVSHFKTKKKNENDLQLYICLFFIRKKKS